MKEIPGNKTPGTGKPILGTAHGLPEPLETVILQVRLPRAAAVLVGAALSAAGAAYQGLFRNPLVSPDILGVSSSAGLGAVLGIYLSLPVIGIQALASLFGLARYRSSMSSRSPSADTSRCSSSSSPALSPARWRVRPYPC